MCRVMCFVSSSLLFLFWSSFNDPRIFLSVKCSDHTNPLFDHSKLYYIIATINIVAN